MKIDCVEAKEVELEKPTSFGVHQEVDDEGHERISLLGFYGIKVMKFMPELWQEDMKKTKN